MNKEEIYRDLCLEVKELVSDTRNWVSNTSNVSALVYSTLRKNGMPVNWVGFYFTDKENIEVKESEREKRLNSHHDQSESAKELVESEKGKSLWLGPFQGEVACLKIGKGRGVCGACVVKRETIVVPDVHKFPGHIACSSLTNSEIVLPLLLKSKGNDNETTIIGVFDLDGLEPNVFDEQDKVGLEAIVEILLQSSDWNIWNV